MSQSGVVSWSQTAADNGTADSNVNFAEGQAPSSLNNSTRAEMASVAKYRDDTAGSLLTTGTSTAYAVTSNQVFSSLSVLDGQSIRVRFHVANGAAPTLNVDSLGDKAINVNEATALGSGVIAADSIWDLTYDDANSIFILVGVPAAAQDATVATASIADSAVTYAKIQNVADQRLLGNFSGAAAAPSEYSIDGASVSGSAISFPNPPAGSFSNLSILVAGNTSATVAADYVTMTDGLGSFVTKALSATLSLASAGAVNRLDTGSISNNKWYAVYAIYNGTTVGTLASLSATAPTMPTGYTYKARIGWLRTDSTTAHLLGTLQYGKRAQYVVGLAAADKLPLIASGTAGTYSLTSPTLTTASISNEAPSTAGAIIIVATNRYQAGTASNVLVAPSTSYGGTNNGPLGSNGMLYPVSMTNSDNFFSTATIVIEATTIAWCSDAGGGAIRCLGWEDNL